MKAVHLDSGTTGVNLGRSPAEIRPFCQAMRPNLYSNYRRGNGPFKLTNHHCQVTCKRCLGILSNFEGGKYGKESN